MSKPTLTKTSRGWFWVNKGGFGFRQLCGPHESSVTAWKEAVAARKRYAESHRLSQADAVIYFPTNPR